MFFRWRWCLLRPGSLCVSGALFPLWHERDQRSPRPPRPLRSLRTCFVVNLWSYVTKVSQAGGLSSLPVPFLKGFTSHPPTLPLPPLQERQGRRARLQVRGGRGLSWTGGPDSDGWNMEGSLAAVPCAACCFVFFSVPSALTDPLSQEDPVERSSYHSPHFSHSCRQNTVTYRCFTEPLGTKVGII